MLELDHLAVTAPSLDAGTAYVEQSLGVSLSEGGAHPEMGTHNRLLRLGERLYLEVIAADAAAPPPKRARWFGLDAPDPVARLSHWIVRSESIETALCGVDLDLGTLLNLQRGQFEWTISVRDDGKAPYSGAAPALLQWRCPRHPADVLPDAGCRLRRLMVSHPNSEQLTSSFPQLLDLRDVEFTSGPIALSAQIETPSGTWTLT